VIFHFHPDIASIPGGKLVVLLEGPPDGGEDGIPTNPALGGVGILGAEDLRKAAVGPGQFGEIGTMDHQGSGDLRNDAVGAHPAGVGGVLLFFHPGNLVEKEGPFLPGGSVLQEEQGQSSQGDEKQDVGKLGLGVGQCC
jgi:hypothetical protein